MIKRLNIILALIICIALCGSGGSLSFFGFAPDGSGNWVQNIAGTKIIIGTNNAGNDGIVIGTTTLLTGQQLRLFNGASGAIKPTNLQFEIDTSSNGGTDIANASANTSGYYFSNPTAAYDGAIEYNNTSRTLFLKSAGQDRWSNNSSGQLVQDGTNGSDILINKSSTGLAATGAVTLKITGSSTAGQGIIYDAANSTGSHAFRVNGAGVFNIDSNGPTTTGTFISSRTTDLGWSVQSAANQACNTTCTSACVFGFNLTAGVPGTLLACTDATADVCLCAGAS